MLRPTTFHDLVSGRTRGARATLARAVLQAAEYPYSAAVKLRNWRYDQAHVASIALPVPVISVGNITLGGTGKTPTVEWLARWFLRHGARPAIVSRGYAAKDGAANDESLELAKRLPEVQQVLNRDRVQGGTTAIDHGANIILLDDAFQHRRIARDLDIVLVDALEPFGYEHLFPRGTLREPLEGWKRANVIALSRADTIRPDERQQIAQRVRHHAPDATWLELTHVPCRLVNSDGQQRDLSSLLDKRVAAFCGIGNPKAFLHALSRLNLHPKQFREYPDHFGYPPAEIARLKEWLTSGQVEAALCTCKDLVKIDRLELATVPVWAVEIELQVNSGQANLERLLEPLAQRALATNRSRRSAS